MAGKETVRQTFGIASSVNVNNFVAGVELEIEDLRNYQLPAGWHDTEDGSLRNNGKEFISPPATVETLVEHFEYIHKSIKWRSSPGKGFSERTSIHVHINCLDQTQEQTRSILLWYALFEPVFFAMVAPSRRNNIHCVGLDQTSLSEVYRRSLPIYVQKWSKYTALNILPLNTQGTIEFRHMDGHGDVQRFKQWLCTLRRLWNWGQSHILSASAIDSSSQILEAFDFIFAESGMKGLRSSVLELVSDNLIDIKLSMV